MKKWIQHVEKPKEHSDYTKIITQIYGSNNLLPDFRQMSPENIVKKNHFIELLDPELKIIGHIKLLAPELKKIGHLKLLMDYV